MADDRAEDSAASRRLAVLAEGSRAFAEAQLDVAEVLAVVVQRTAELIGDVCAIRLLSPDGTTLLPGVSYHPEPEARAFVQAMLAEQPQRVGEGLSGRVAQSGEPLVIPRIPWETYRAQVKPEYWPYIERFGVHSSIMVPLRVRGRITGTLNMVRDRTPEPYTADDTLVVQDLAERAAVAIENARLYEAAQAAVRAREQFLSNAAHELRTPLTTLLGHVAIIQRRLGREHAPQQWELRSLAGITEQGQRLNRLVEALIELTNLQSGQTRLALEPVDLTVLVAETAASFRPTLRRHTLALDTAAAPLVVRADARRLSEALHTLLDNAVRYSPDGGQIAVQLTAAGGRACLAVTDPGIGVPAAEQEHIFEQFYRASNVDPQQTSGLGIGLFLARDVVTKHGGTLTLTPSQGHGTTFEIALPLTTEPAPF